MPPRTALKDSKVNFRLGTGSLQVKVEYSTDPAAKAPPLTLTIPTLPSCTTIPTRG